MRQHLSTLRLSKHRRLALLTITGALMIGVGVAPALAQPALPLQSRLTTTSVTDKSGGDPLVVTVVGKQRFGHTLSAQADSEEELSYQWWRDELAIPGATAANYRVRKADLQRRLWVEVSTDSGRTGVSARTSKIRRAQFRRVSKPRLRGVKRFGRTLTLTAGKFVPAPKVVRYQWWRDGQRIPRARSRHYQLRPKDVGKRISVTMVLRRPHYQKKVVRRAPNARVKHRVDATRAFTYEVITRGHITAEVTKFARQARKIFNHPRGWRGAGFGFRQVARGGDFSLVLASAETLPSFGFPCSSMWSCRSGRYVIINQTRWLTASPAWNEAGLRRGKYRHMVINHETGHWLGHRHASCGGPGQLAPVMMQQSKGRMGCRFNPFPLPSERWASR